MNPSSEEIYQSINNSLRLIKNNIRTEICDFENQKGFCPIPLYSLNVIYQNAVNNDFPPKEYRDNAWWWHNEKTGVGRNYKSESPQIKKYMTHLKRSPM